MNKWLQWSPHPRCCFQPQCFILLTQLWSRSTTWGRRPFLHLDEWSSTKDNQHIIRKSAWCWHWVPSKLCCPWEDKGSASVCQHLLLQQTGSDSASTVDIFLVFSFHSRVHIKNDFRGQRLFSTVRWEILSLNSFRLQTQTLKADSDPTLSLVYFMISA